MGTIDRVIRILLAIVVIVLYLNGSITGVAAIILGMVAFIFIVTSLIGFYSQPAYLPLLIWIWMTASFTAIMKVYSTSGLIGKLCALY